MLMAGGTSLVLFSLALLVYIATPPAVFTDAGSPHLWLFIVLTLVGTIVGNLRGIAVSALVTSMITEGERTKANGLVRAAIDVAFPVASILSGSYQRRINNWQVHLIYSP